MDTVRSSLQVAENAAEPVQESVLAGARSFQNHYRTALLSGVMAVVCVVVCHRIRLGEFDFNVDEAQHAVTGLFIADALHDMPLRHPVEYAYRYYAQYPAIAIVHWPPLFYLCEGLSFLLLGPGVVAARGTVLLFALLLCYQWFRLVEELQDATTAAVATCMLALLPSVLLFEKTVMLEIPSLALSVAAIRAWIRYLEEGKRASVYEFAIWFSAAMLCKQTSVFIPVFCLFSLIATRRWERLWRRDAVLAGLLSALLVGPFYVLMLVSQGASVAQDLGTHQMTGLQRFLFYWRALPITFTIPMLALSVLGLLLSRRWSSKEQTLLMVCWILAGYLTFTFFGQKESRFTIYWFPPLVYFASGLLTNAFRIKLLRTAMRGVAVAIVVVMAVHAWAYERPYIAGYETAAARLVENYHSGIVLFDGKVPGNFVFYMRALDPRRQFLVLRKSLYASDVRKNQSSEEFVASREDLQNLFREDGIHFIVVAQNTPLEFRSQVTLREYLESDQFQRLGRFPIESNEPNWQGRSLLLYENKQWAAPAGKVLMIRMLTLHHDIVVPLDDFDFVHGQNPAAPAGDR
jgi:hypothetical protein